MSSLNYRAAIRGCTVLRVIWDDYIWRYKIRRPPKWMFWKTQKEYLAVLTKSQKLYLADFTKEYPTVEQQKKAD